MRLFSFVILVRNILQITFYLATSVLSKRRPFTMSKVTWLDKLQQQGMIALPFLVIHFKY